MHKVSILIIILAVCMGCEDEEKPKNPPEIGDARITCKEPRRQGEYPEVDEVTVLITDVERDLVPSTIKGTINGLAMKDFIDPDADERYSWSPAVESEPPMVCHGEFTMLIEAADLGGRMTTKTLTFSP